MNPSLSHARSADGVSIAWSVAGTGPALVLMPGVPFSNFEAEWRIPVLRRAFSTFAETVRLIQYDGRGTGRSQRDISNLSLDAMLADIDAVLDAAGVGSVVLQGFYHSCTHAIAYAARHPERVAGIVLFGGALRGWDPMSSPGMQALLSLIERDWDTFAESAAHAWLGWPDGAEGRLAAEWFRTATTPGVARATLQAASAIDVTADAAAVRCPALVLHREDAPVIPLAMSQELAAALPRGRLEATEGAVEGLRPVGSRAGGPSTPGRWRHERPDRRSPGAVDQHGRAARRKRLPQAGRARSGGGDGVGRAAGARLTAFRHRSMADHREVRRGAAA
jgi:pimeloyl-ACP methyl ester carboxylesterase